MEHRLLTKRRVAFESFETGRRFLVCAQPVSLMLSHVHCSVGTNTDVEAYCFYHLVVMMLIVLMVTALV